MPVTVRLLQAADEAVLQNVALGVFDEAVDGALTKEFLTDPRHHIAAALDGDLVVGMATAVHYVHPDKPVELWINEVAVDDAWRRRGIAKQLMDLLFAHGRTLGCTVAWLGTESSNTAAMALYSTITESDVFFEFDLGRD